MCTVVLLWRPADPDWPLILGANRDEMRDRPWRAPGRHWPARPDVVAGQDALAGGSWLGVNDDGVVAAVLNRDGSLGPTPDHRSRGELTLEALDHADALAAVDALTHLDPNAYRSFNMLVADNRHALWVKSAGDGSPVEAAPAPQGVSLLTAHDLNDATASPRIRAYLPRFRAAPKPQPNPVGGGDWRAWSELLGSRLHDPQAGPRGAMRVETDIGFGTVSSSLIALPGLEHTDRRPVFLFAGGPPGAADLMPVSFD